jgi:hypothetical protein
MPNRVKDFATTATAATIAGDDFLALDGNTNGSRKITPANLLPAQTNNVGKFLTTDGSALSWGTAGGGAADDDQNIIANQVFG